MLGSFGSRTNADGFARQHTRYGAFATMVKIKGRHYHRVIAGQFAMAEIADVRRSLQVAGIRQPWTIKGCRAGAPSVPSCISVWQARVEGQPGKEGPQDR